MPDAARPASVATPPSLDSPAPIYANDHLLPPTNSDRLPTLVLYGNPTSLSFASLFLALHALAAPPTGQAKIQLAVRWKPSASPLTAGGDKLALSGYGALLDIKKVDYIAIDDRAAKTGTGAKEAVRGSEHGPRIYPIGDYDLGSASSL